MKTKSFIFSRKQKSTVLGRTLQFGAALSCSLLCTYLMSPGWGPGLAAQTQNPLRLSVDIARFRGDSTHAKLEICQGISRQGLTYQRNKAGLLVARFQIETQILEEDSVVFRQKIAETDTIYGAEKIEPGQQFIYLHPFFLKPGFYKVLTILEDNNNDRRSSNRVPLEISPVIKNTLALSDIQFARHIKKASNLNSPFLKNNLDIMPNPQSLYGDGLEDISFYAELYNLGSGDGLDGTYSVDYIIKDSEGKILSRIHGRQRPKQSESTAIYASFDISSLKSNRYTLQLDVTNNTTDKHAGVSKNFSVFRKADALAFQSNQERKMYESFGDSTIQNYFAQISPIATEEEKYVFKQLELQGAREFLVQFWQGRDPSPGTPENEFKEDYIQRLLKVKIHFSSDDVEGWQTDRGRILLKYGTPDFIDREPALPDRNAHEIWSYETLQGVQGQSLFVFIDLNENGKFRLIHSDHRDEMTNNDWESYLYK